GPAAEQRVQPVAVHPTGCDSSPEPKPDLTRQQKHPADQQRDGGRGALGDGAVVAAPRHMYGAYRPSGSPVSRASLSSRPGVRAGSCPVDASAMAMVAACGGTAPAGQRFERHLVADIPPGLLAPQPADLQQVAVRLHRVTQPADRPSIPGTST